MKIISIAFNTFLEILRQPFFSIILLVGAIATLTSPVFSMFALMESIKLVQDMALANMLLCGLFLAIYCVGDTVGNEVQYSTALTLLSKPISRSEFIMSKFLGIMMTLLLSFYLLSIVSLLTIKFGVADRASVQLNKQVLWMILAAFFLSIIYGGLMNYMTRRVFLSNALGSSFFFFSAALIGGCMLNHNYELIIFGSDINWEFLKSAFLIFAGCSVLCAFACTLVTRINMTLTAVLTFVFFLTSVIWAYLSGHIMGSTPVASLLYPLLPDFQLFWMADALNSGHILPFNYLFYVTLYASSFIVFFVLLACHFFEDADVR